MALRPIHFQYDPLKSANTLYLPLGLFWRFYFKLYNIKSATNLMKRKVGGLDPITKSQASYEKLMLEMMSKLVYEIRENSSLIKEVFGKGNKPSSMANTHTAFRKDNNLPLGVTAQDWSDIDLSPAKNIADPRIQEVYQSRSGNNIKHKGLQPSLSRSRLERLENNSTEENEKKAEESKMERVLVALESRLKAGEDVNRKLLEKMEKLERLGIQKQLRDNSKAKNDVSRKDLKEASSKENEMSLIEKAIADKFTKTTVGEGKKNSYILSEILPYSDRREIKVKFKISDIVDMAQQSRIDDLKVETAEWLGQVYRATASICWNMLLNKSLSFEEVKILFTENIVFNFIEFMKEVKKIGRANMEAELTSIINKKSVTILDFLCRQYPQTKIEAPNLALRSILPQVDNQGRSKYDLVCNSGISFTYREDADYTAQIMRMINFMIERGNEEFEGFFGFMRETFDEVFLPIHSRTKLEAGKARQDHPEPSQEDLAYRGKVSQYTKYLIGRKIPKNTGLYSEEEIDDGIFFVKSNAVLRIITKWVQELKEYFQNPEKRIKYNYNENKDHGGGVMYLSTLIKNGIYNQTLKDREGLFEKIDKIRQECEKMAHLLTGEEYTSDTGQIHLSEEQISVGLYCCNIKSVISSYICSELNELIHFLLKIPREVQEDALGNDNEVFQLQARKELDSVNLITFKLADLLRCKIHSNEEQIIWIVQYLLYQSENNRQRFKVVRIKDRLSLGTRDIMINAQINRGLVCEIQLSVTSHSDKKQELLDSYNHFLYELKRSELGSIIENVSIWSNLEQRFSYFEQLINKKSRKRVSLQATKVQRHKCGVPAFRSFKRPLICAHCNKFFPIPTTCLLNVVCTQCATTFCGECYYYNYLNTEERKEFIFDGPRLFKPDVMCKLMEYTDRSQAFPATGFFIKKDFLTKEMSFYMAIQRNKQENVKDAPKVEILVIQTIIRQGVIFNRQVNKRDIEARLEKGEFFIKDYDKTELSNFLIFYFDKKQDKRMMTLQQLQTELKKPEHAKSKVLSILREPSYIHNLRPLKKESDKVRQFNSLSEVIKEGKVIVYVFSHLFILAQVLVKGALLRADVRKRLNLNELKSFAEKETDIVSMEYKSMTTEMEEIATKIKPKLYACFRNNLRKLFLSNGNIESIKFLGDFQNLETVFINENSLTSLEGIEGLKELMSFRFDSNQVQSLEPFANSLSMRYLSANSNKIKSLKGLGNLKELRSLSVYENQIESIEELRDHPSLEELYVRSNPIFDFSVVETLKKLTRLFMGRTKINKIPDLSHLSNLRSLSLEGMSLETVPEMIASLTLNQLSLAFNNLTGLTNLGSQTELVSLTLSRNKITAIGDIDALDKLETLKLNDNQITTVRGVMNLESLRYLGLKNNPIEDIGELASYEISFKYGLTLEALSENAKKQLSDLEVIKNSISSSED